jgi:hypothetical protein
MIKGIMPTYQSVENPEERIFAYDQDDEQYHVLEKEDALEPIMIQNTKLVPFVMEGKEPVISNPPQPAPEKQGTLTSTQPTLEPKITRTQTVGLPEARNFLGNGNTYTQQHRPPTIAIVTPEQKNNLVYIGGGLLVLGLGLALVLKK